MVNYKHNLYDQYCIKKVSGKQANEEGDYSVLSAVQFLNEEMLKHAAHVITQKEGNLEEDKYVLLETEQSLSAQSNEAFKPMGNVEKLQRWFYIVILNITNMANLRAALA